LPDNKITGLIKGGKEMLFGWSTKKLPQKFEIKIIGQTKKYFLPGPPKNT